MPGMVVQRPVWTSDAFEFVIWIWRVLKSSQPQIGVLGTNRYDRFAAEKKSHMIISSEFMPQVGN